jgi:hypothetical protein
MRAYVTLLLLLFSSDACAVNYCQPHKGQGDWSRRKVDGVWCYYQGRFDEVKPKLHKTEPMTPSKQDEKELLEESVWGPEPKKSEFQERWDSLDWESIQSQR